MLLSNFGKLFVRKLGVETSLIALYQRQGRIKKNILLIIIFYRRLLMYLVPFLSSFFGRGGFPWIENLQIYQNSVHSQDDRNEEEGQYSKTGREKRQINWFIKGIFYSNRFQLPYTASIYCNVRYKIDLLSVQSTKSLRFVTCSWFCFCM